VKSENDGLAATAASSEASSMFDTSMKEVCQRSDQIREPLFVASVRLYWQTFHGR
jgi:hypothetical protein